MLPQAIVSLEGLDGFVRDLKQLTTQLRDSISRRQGQFSNLGDTWRDQEFEQMMRAALQQFMRPADQRLCYTEEHPWRSV